VCRAGQTLDPNQAALLRVFGVKMATFRLTPLAWWSGDGEQQQQGLSLHAAGLLCSL
jgi:mRNA turnover protein 4